MGRIEFSGNAGLALMLTAIFSFGVSAILFVGLFQTPLTNLYNQAQSFITVSRIGNYTAGNGTQYPSYFQGYNYMGSLPTVLTMGCVLVVFAVLVVMIIKACWGLTKRVYNDTEKITIRYIPTEYKCKVDNKIARRYGMEKHLLQEHAQVLECSADRLDDIEAIN